MQIIFRRMALKAPPVTEERVLLYLNRQARPVFLGVLACNAGVSLQQAQSAVDQLVERGQVRSASASEREALDALPDSALYVLVGSAHPGKAYW